MTPISPGLAGHAYVSRSEALEGAKLVLALVEAGEAFAELRCAIEAWKPDSEAP